MARVCGMCGEVKEEFCERCGSVPHFECNTIRKHGTEEDFEPAEVASGAVCSGCCWCHMLTPMTALEAFA